MKKMKKLVVFFVVIAIVAAIVIANILISESRKTGFINYINAVETKEYDRTKIAPDGYYWKYIAKGLVRNVSDTSICVYVTVDFYNRSNARMGWRSDYVKNLPPREAWRWECSYETVGNKKHYARIHHHKTEVFALNKVGTLASWHNWHKLINKSDGNNGQVEIDNEEILDGNYIWWTVKNLTKNTISCDISAKAWDTEGVLVKEDTVEFNRLATDDVQHCRIWALLKGSDIDKYELHVIKIREYENNLEGKNINE